MSSNDIKSNSDNKVNEEQLSTFNFESVITIEKILSYFFNDEINITRKNIINYYKIINYYLLNKFFENGFFPTNSYTSILIQQLLNLQLISVLLFDLISIKHKISDKNILVFLKNIIKNNYQNFLLLSQILMNLLQKKSMTNIYCYIINEKIIKNSTYKIFNDIDKIIPIIELQNKTIEKQIKIILNSEKIDKSIKDSLNFMSYKISNNNTKEIIDKCLKLLNLSEKEIIKLKSRNYITDNQNKIFYSLKVPFLPKLDIGINYKLTIILDLDETLIYQEQYEEEEEFEENEKEEEDIIFRPGLFELLDFFNKSKFEIIVFTSSNKEYADKKINEIEKNKKYFNSRLFRENCILVGNAYIKDLSKLGRELSKVIIIDNDRTSFYFQPENGILIKSFFGSNKDRILFNLKEMLSDIIKNEFKDIRLELKKYINDIKNRISK